jgi:Ca2+-binding EF-hand superfamily protein
MFQASNIFRTYDLNFSGFLDYNEWRLAMHQLGYYMNDFDAGTLDAISFLFLSRILRSTSGKRTNDFFAVSGSNPDGSIHLFLILHPC